MSDRELEPRIVDEAPLVEATLDEGRFLRQVRWRSGLRTALISFAVLVTVLLATLVVKGHLLGRQEGRISMFYDSLIRYSEPNTLAVPGSGHDLGWLSRQKEYHLFRMVDTRPVPIGTVTVDFQVWGGEQFLDPSRSVVRVEDGREYLLPNMVPALRFFHPAAEKDALPRDFDLLAGIPRDATVEMALSFNRLLTRREMEAVLPDGIRPLWGAISAYSDEEIAKKGHLAGRLVGIPLGGFRMGEGRITEDEFAGELDRLSRVPSHSSQQLERTSGYLKANGIRYYGVVVAGSPEDLSRLADSQLISAAVLGIVAR